MKHFDPYESFMKMAGAVVALTAALGLVVICGFSLVALCRVMYGWLF